MIKGSDGSRVPLRGRTLRRCWHQPYIFVNAPPPKKNNNKNEIEENLVRVGLPQIGH